MKTVWPRGAAAILCATLAGAGVGAPRPAWAAGDPPSTPAASASPAPSRDAVAQAGEHFSRGVKLYEEDDFRAALIEFNRAYELAPNWAVLYNVGQSAYQLRDYATALRTLEKYVGEGGDNLSPDRRAQVTREIAELRGRVAHVTIVSNVEGADVALDDTPLGKASSSDARLVGAGRHKVTVSHAGFATASQVVDIAGGDMLTIRLDLAPLAAPASATPVEHGAPSYAGAIVGGIAGVAGIAVGTVFGVLTMNTKSSLDSQCNGAKICPASAQNDIDAYTRDGALSGIGFGVGVVGLVLAGYSFFHEHAKESGAAPATAGLRVTPWLAPTSGGLTGSF
jgi:hypothetical protein